MDFEVDRKSSQPIYLQLVSWIESNITNGEWPPEYKLPGEVELADSIGISRGSLRKAIGLLIEKGLVVQIHGKGTFVAQPVFLQSFAGRLSVYQDLMVIGVPFTTEVLEQRIIPAPDKEAKMLDISPAEAVFYLKRRRSIKGDPMVVHESFFSAERFGGLMGDDFTKAGMVETVEKHYNITLEWTSHTISVARANADIASLLKLRINDPVLFTRSILYDNAGNKVETALTWFRPDRFHLKTTTRRAQNEPFYSMLGRTAEINFHKSAVVENNQNGSQLYQFLPLERISINQQFANWEEAVLFAGKLLFESGVAEEKYARAMVNTAKHLGPYFVVAPGIAVAHALPSEGVIKPALAMVTLKPTLPFGNKENDPVRLLIAIAAVDTRQHVEALKEIADVLSESARRRALMHTRTPQEAFDILTGKMEVKEN